MQNTLIDAADRQAAPSVSCFYAEPTLADLLSDPMTHNVMAADHIDYWDLDTLLRTARHFMALSSRMAQ
jgi:hypothetical protein